MADNILPRLTHRRFEVLMFLADARTSGDRVSLSIIQRRCCIRSRSDAREIVLALQDAGYLLYCPPGDYMPTRKAAKLNGDGRYDIRERVKLGATG